MTEVELARLKLKPMPCGELRKIMQREDVAHFIMQIGPDTPKKGEYVLVDLTGLQAPFNVSFRDRLGDERFVSTSTMATLVKTSSEAIAEVFSALPYSH